MNFKKKYSFIIPVKNQEKNIKNNLEKLIKVIENCDYVANYEIIVIDDGSIDKTFEIIKSISKQNRKVKVKKNQLNMGKGFSIKKGVGLINKNSQKIILIDSDIPYIQKLSNLIYKLNTNKIVIINRRDKKSKLILKKRNFYIYYRLLIGYALNLFFRLIRLTNLKDTQAGLKGFDASFKNHFKEIKTHGFLFDLEILYILIRKNYNPISIPCNYSISSKSSIKFNLQIYLRIFNDLIIIIYNFLLKNYK